MEQEKTPSQHMMVNQTKFQVWYQIILKRQLEIMS